jgi:hypothetical protein
MVGDGKCYVKGKNPIAILENEYFAMINQVVVATIDIL